MYQQQQQFQQPQPASSGGGCCDPEGGGCNALPDACTNDIREENLIQRQSDTRNWAQRFVDRDRFLILSCFILIVCMNVSTGRYLLYPFQIFATWIHEQCHGLAAILMGGGIAKMEIFKDGSGLCYTYGSSGFRRGFVASAGYPGTAVTGCLMLLHRRTTLGPTIGVMGIGGFMILSCALWVRNAWGLITLLTEGVVLLLLGWFAPAVIVDNLFNFLAATCCLNAVESIRDLFAIGNYYVDGEEVTTSDAHTVADKWGFDYRFWALSWLIMSFVLTLIGIVFARDAKATKWFKGSGTKGVNAANTNNVNANDMVYANNNAVMMGGNGAGGGQYYAGSGMYPAQTMNNNFYPAGQPAPYAPSAGGVYTNQASNMASAPAVVYGEAVTGSNKTKRNWWGGKKKSPVASNEIQHAVVLY